MTHVSRRIWAVLLASLLMALFVAGQEDVKTGEAGADQKIDGKICLEEPSAAEATIELSPAPSEPEIVVEDYLESLSQEELAQICRERGFEVSKDEDYLEAARRCLSLEDEMNAVLAEHPELAAELDSEIARLQTSKELLEEQNQELLEEVLVLQAQLEQAGVDTAEYKGLLEQHQQQQRHGLDAANMTAKEVFGESLTQLFERVRRDLVVIGRILSPVIRSAVNALRLLWRYAEPVATQAYQQVAVVAKIVWKQVEPIVGDKIKDSWKRAEPVMARFLKKIMEEGKKLLAKIMEATEPKPRSDGAEGTSK